DESTAERDAEAEQVALADVDARPVWRELRATEPQLVEHERAALDDAKLDDHVAALAALFHLERDVAEEAEREHLEPGDAQPLVGRVQDVARLDRQRAPDDLVLRCGVALDVDRLDQEHRSEVIPIQRDKLVCLRARAGYEQAETE